MSKEARERKTNKTTFSYLNCKLSTINVHLTINVSSHNLLNANEQYEVLFDLKIVSAADPGDRAKGA